MSPDVPYTLCATSSMGKTGDIITFMQFEERNLVSETREDVESGDESGNESYDNSIMPPLLSEEESNALDSGDESDDEPISTEMLEDIIDRSQSHPDINRRDAHYKMRDHIKQIQLERKGALKATQNMGKGSHKVFITVVKDFFLIFTNFG